jgi:hypothetical protein
MVGLGLARSCAVPAGRAFWATGLEREAHTGRQQWREWCSEAAAKRGGPRQELAGETCCASFGAWVLSWWEGKHLAGAGAATTWGHRCVGLVSRVLSGGCALAVAWPV